MLRLIPKLDALLALFGAIADVLAATGDLLKDETGQGARPTIH
ncbi:MAG TPA: hypothetical protein VN737_11425 [Bryobacteraceae bacterium]|nr:hypothetical protein [Bryobacteraceae bacterium]